MHQTIVIVGAGFCGSVLAANLLRNTGRKDIVLIERGTSIGRGVAYAAHDVPYVLNVPAGRLSVEPGDPCISCATSANPIPMRTPRISCRGRYTAAICRRCSTRRNAAPLTGRC